MIETLKLGYEVTNTEDLEVESVEMLMWQVRSRCRHSSLMCR